VGMRVYDPSVDLEYRCYTKAYGRELETKDMLKEAFRKYFSAASGRCWSKFLAQLRPIQRWFEDNDCFAFYSSSILLVYEGEGNDSDDVTVKLIDFGRVRRQANGDYGYRYGLETLISILSELSKEQNSNNSTSTN
jgi:Inositol polyphosphate kinase